MINNLLFSMLAISQCQCPWTGRRECTLTHLDQFAGRPSDQRTPLWREAQSPESEDTQKMNNGG